MIENIYCVLIIGLKLFGLGDDKENMKTLISCLLFILSGCVSVPTKMNKLAVGMQKDQVIKIMGEPDNVAMGASEGNLYYSEGDMVKDWYFVHLKDDQVTGYGPVPLSQAQMEARQRAAMFLMAHPITMPTQAPTQNAYIYRPAAQQKTNINCTSNTAYGTTYTNCQ